jgi:hypothetical protein
MLEIEEWRSQGSLAEEEEEKGKLPAGLAFLVNFWLEQE